VGEFRLGQFRKRVIQGQFSDPEGAEAVGFSHSNFGLVVQAFDYAAGEELLGLEVVQDEIAVCRSMLLPRAWNAGHATSRTAYD
jgi:hypothetical protein